MLSEKREMTTEKIDERKLPLIYRLILKLPKPSLDFLPEFSHGIYWAVIVPIFLTLESFMSLFLLVGFPFPLNLLLAGIIPTIIFILFLRISLERFINWWNANVAHSGFEWNVEKSAKEYLDFLEKKKSKRK